MNKLDLLSDEYKPDAATSIENELILNWYPNRILKKVKEKGSLLELGIGHGHTSKFFNNAFKHHVIIEGSKTVINQFNKMHPTLNITLHHEWFEEFETQEKFDVIIMGFILEHVEDPEYILKKYKKYLKPNGQIFIAVPNAKSLNRRFGLELKKIPNIYALNENDIAFGHKRQYCLKTLEDEITKAGYKILNTEGIYLKPLPLNIIKTLEDYEDNLKAMLEVGIEFPDLCVAILMEIKLSHDN